MTFIDQRLPEQVEINATRRESEPGTTIVKTDGGFEVANIRHAQNELAYDISYPASDYDGTIALAVKEMWKASRGAIAFRFRDWDPVNSALEDEVIGSKDGVTTAFQITKTWTVGGQSQVRNVTRPVSPLVVKLNGVVTGAGYSINYATGVLTFSSPTGTQAISVSGLYDIPVRFEGSFEATGMAEFLEHIETLALVEVKE
jgi:uncharacterized protein (TIGR02217 family)